LSEHLGPSVGDNHTRREWARSRLDVQSEALWRLTVLLYGTHSTQLYDFSLIPRYEYAWTSFGGAKLRRDVSTAWHSASVGGRASNGRQPLLASEPSPPCRAALLLCYLGGLWSLTEARVPASLAGYRDRDARRPLRIMVEVFHHWAAAFWIAIVTSQPGVSVNLLRRLRLSRCFCFVVTINRCSKVCDFHTPQMIIRRCGGVDISRYCMVQRMRG